MSSTLERHAISQEAHYEERNDPSESVRCNLYDSTFTRMHLAACEERERERVREREGEREKERAIPWVVETNLSSRQVLSGLVVIIPRL